MSPRPTAPSKSHLPERGSWTGHRYHRRLLPVLALLLWFAAIGGALGSGLPVAELKVGNEALTVEIASTPEAMNRGLMFRDHMPEDHGMLFVWPREQRVAMWMKNTRIPLSVAFINDDFRILNIADMEPHSLRAHSSRGHARYALEVNQGWFTRNGVQEGARVDDLERLMADLSTTHN